MIYLFKIFRYIIYLFATLYITFIILPILLFTAFAINTIEFITQNTKK